MDEVQRAVKDLCESVGLEYDPSNYYSTEPMDDTTIDVIMTTFWEARGRTNIAPIVDRPIGEMLDPEVLDAETHDEDVLREAFLGRPIFEAPTIFESRRKALRSELRDLPLASVMSALMNSNLLTR